MTVKRILKSILTVISLAILAAVMVSCGGELRYSDSTEKLQSAIDKIQKAEEITDKRPDIKCTYSYMVSSEVGNKIYEMGIKNVLIMSGRGSADFKANRYNYYHGTSANESETFNYSNGKIYAELYNTDYTSPMTEEKFGEFTSDTKYSVDTEIFDMSDFEEVAVGKDKESGYDVIAFRSDKKTIKDKVIDFLGLRETDYVYGVSDVSMEIFIDKTGEIVEKKLIFTAKYYPEYDSLNSVTYDGVFTYRLDSKENVTVSDPYISDDVQEIADINTVYGFLEKSYGVLSTFTTLDATYREYIKNSDVDKNEYILENWVNFTEAYRDGKYTYGSIDTQYIKTKDTDGTVSNGMFIDENGFHSRSTAEDYEEVSGGEKPYSDFEFVTMIANTLASGMPLEKEVEKLRVTESDNEYIYTYSFTNEVVISYGEYLMSAFTASGEINISLEGQAFSVEKNETVIRVRKSDGCIISHSLKYDVWFGGSIRLESEFDMTVNASGDEVKVLSVSDWNKNS